MKPSERVRAVYQGRKPDQVPLPELVVKYGGY